MKIYKMLLFMAGVLIGLTFLTFIFPRDGLTFSSTTLTFPTLSEVLAVDESKAGADTLKILTPEDILVLREQELGNDKEYTEYMRSNPARLYLPSEDYLDPFFNDLDSAKSSPIRILHYGDSQIEMDRISSYLREQLQQEYGGCGVGFMPAVQNVATTTISQSISPSLRYFMPYGGADSNLRKDGDYGPMVRCAELSGRTTFTCRKTASKDCPHAGEFSRVSVMVRGDISACCQTKTASIPLKTVTPSGSSVKILRADLGENVSKITLQLNGTGRIYGVSVDGDAGVSVDNIPMRGCSGTVFTIVKEDAMKTFFSGFKVPLVILQYGGNSVPYLNTDQKISVYMNMMRKQLEHLKKTAPKSRFLFIGPADMSKKKMGEYHTYDRLPQVIDSLRAVARESGIAFWDMYASMGGYDSMVRWVNSGLAGKDYLHFSNKGAATMAKMLYDNITFIRNHRRKATEAVINEADSIIYE